MKIKFEIVLFLLILIHNQTTAQSIVKIKIDTENPGTEIPSDFCGLSYEIKLVNPDSATGKYYFSSSNKALINVFKTLGIKSLRIGGNTADRPTVRIPDERDIDTLFAFAKETGVKVIYTVRLRNGNPEDAAEIVKYIMANYFELLSCITIGNEPNMFAEDFDVYLEEWKKFADIINSYSPGVKFCGPSATPGHTVWAEKFANALGISDYPIIITQHDYPGKNPTKIPDIETARQQMLSKEWHKLYQNFYDSFVPVVLSNKLIFRIEEANSFYNGGAVGASDNFTSSLWILDYLYWWTQHNAGGINFHTGEKVLPGGTAKPNVYTAISSSPKGIKVFPTGYGMKAFNLGSKGRIVPTDISENSNNINITAYSTFGSDNNLFITIINKEFGAEAHSVNATIETGKSINKIESIILSAPEITTVEGVMLGDSKIQEDGSWEEKWMENSKKSNGTTGVTIPPASAVIVKINLK